MTQQISPDFMAAQAKFLSGGAIPQWFVPQRVWVKDYPGQVTDGLIGRPAIRMAPLEWLDGPTRRAVQTILGIEIRHEVAA